MYSPHSNLIPNLQIDGRGMKKFSRKEDIFEIFLELKIKEAKWRSKNSQNFAYPAPKD